MTTTKRVLFGILGALSPLVMNLLVVDFSDASYLSDKAKLLGLLVKIFVFMFAGALIAYFNSDETSPLKIFQLGLAAPALLTAYVNANNVQPHSSAPAPLKASIGAPVAPGVPDSPQSPDKPSTSFLDSIFPVAYAASNAPIAEKPSGFLNQFWEGLTGIKNRKYYVVVATEHSLESAKQRADEINRTKQGFHADAYKALNGLYGVGIGFDLTYEQAVQLRKKALDAGFPHDTYIVWKVVDDSWADQ